MLCASLCILIILKRNKIIFFIVSTLIFESESNSIVRKKKELFLHSKNESKYYLASANNLMGLNLIAKHLNKMFVIFIPVNKIIKNESL